MRRGLVLILVWCAMLWAWRAQPSLAREANDGTPDSVWTAIIPDAFPHYVYTWRMRLDGTYREDARDALRGTPIQPTLAGRWRREGPRLTLRQDDQPFVFDGVVLGSLYTGTLYFDGRNISRFCAAKGEEAPKQCDTASGIAAIAARHSPTSTRGFCRP